MLAAILALSCGNAAEAPEAQDSAQARARLAAVRARISDLTTHLGAELAQRDALNARLRAADLAILEKRKRLDSLHAAQAAADRRRTELLAEQRRNQSALEAERGTLAAQMRAAYMIGRQEQMKLLLNQGNPAIVGRMLVYYGYFARERSAKISAIGDRVAILQGLVGEIERQTAMLQALEAAARSEMADLERARAERRAKSEKMVVATYAKRFAAKEACSKALGTGIRRGVWWRDMGVVNLPGGRPTMQLTGGALARLAELTPQGYEARIDLSITDDWPLAQAFVIISAVHPGKP